MGLLLACTVCGLNVVLENKFPALLYSIAQTCWERYRLLYHYKCLVQHCINSEVIGAWILCQDKAEEGGVAVATVTDDNGIDRANLTTM